MADLSKDWAKATKIEDDWAGAKPIKGDVPPPDNSDPFGVPEWGRKNPNLYGLYGAGRAIAREGIKGGASALGAIGGAAVPLPGATLAGGGLGYALGSEATRKLGLEEEPDQGFSGGQFAKNALIGGAMTGAGKVAGIGGKAIQNALARKTPSLESALMRTPITELASDFKAGAPTNIAARATTMPQAPKPATTKQSLGEDIKRGANYVNSKFRDSYQKKQFYLDKAMPMKGGAAETPAALQQLRDNRITGVDGIGAVKDDIVLTRHGEKVTGALPQTVTELMEAIPQAKQAVFQKTAPIVQHAEDSGLRIPIAKATSAVRGFIGDPSLEASAPGVVKEAERLIGVVEKNHPDGTMSPMEAERYVKQFNSVLDDYYQKGSFSDTDRAKVLAVFTNNLRGDFVETVGKVSPEFKELRRLYGAIDSLEPDAVRLSIKAGNKNAARHMSWLDIVAAEEAVGATTSARPTEGFTRAATTKLLSKMRVDSPDRAVKNLFNEVGKSVREPLKVPVLSDVPPSPRTVINEATGGRMPATAGQGMQGPTSPMNVTGPRVETTQGPSRPTIPTPAPAYNAQRVPINPPSNQVAREWAAPEPAKPPAPATGKVPKISRATLEEYRQEYPDATLDEFLDSLETGSTPKKKRYGK